MSVIFICGAACCRDFPWSMCEACVFADQGSASTKQRPSEREPHECLTGGAEPPVEMLKQAPLTSSLLVMSQ